MLFDILSDSLFDTPSYKSSDKQFDMLFHMSFDKKFHSLLDMQLHSPLDNQSHMQPRMSRRFDKDSDIVFDK